LVRMVTQKQDRLNLEYLPGEDIPTPEDRKIIAGETEILRSRGSLGVGKGNGKPRKEREPEWEADIHNLSGPWAAATPSPLSQRGEQRDLRQPGVLPFFPLSCTDNDRG